jgi:hypothetical protein
MVLLADRLLAAALAEELVLMDIDMACGPEKSRKHLKHPACQVRKDFMLHAHNELITLVIHSHPRHFDRLTPLGRQNLPGGKLGVSWKFLPSASMRLPISESMPAAAPLKRSGNF